MYNDQVICIMLPQILYRGLVNTKVFHYDISNKRFGFIALYILPNNVRNPACNQ